MAVLDNDMSSGIMQSDARRLRLTEHPRGDARRLPVVERPFARVLDDVLRVCCQRHGSSRCRKARWRPVLDGTVSSSTVEGCA